MPVAVADGSVAGVRVLADEFEGVGVLAAAVGLGLDPDEVRIPDVVARGRFAEREVAAWESFEHFRPPHDLPANL